MFHFKQSTINSIAIGIVDNVTQLGVTGLLFTDVTCKLVKSFGVEVTKTLAGTDWTEIGDGWYWIKLSAGDCDTLGPGFIVVTTGTQKGAYPFQILANNSADVMARLGTPVGASIDADIIANAPVAGGALEASVQAVKAKTDNLPASPAAVGSNMGTVTNVTGDVQGKVLGGGASAMTAAGVRAVDATGAAVAPAATALSTVQWTNARAALVDNADAAVSSRLATSGYLAPDNVGIANAMHAALGLFVVLGVPTYNPSTPDLATVRVRLYDSQGHANTDDGATGLVVQFTKAVTYTATAISGTAHQLSKVVGS